MVEEKQNNKKKIQISIIVIVVVIAIVVATWLLTKKSKNNSNLSIKKIFNPLKNTSSVSDHVPNSFADYEEMKSQKSKLGVALFYSDACFYCKAMTPTIKAIEYVCQQLNIESKFVSIEGGSIPRDFIIEGFPTLYILTGESTQVYTGQRTVKAILETALSTSDQLHLMPSDSDLRSLVSKWQEQKLASSDLVTVL